MHAETDRWSDRQTDRETDMQTERKKHNKTSDNPKSSERVWLRSRLH